MTSEKDFLERLIQELDRQQIPYMLSGSIASSLHGRPRATRDVDMVIAPTEEQLLSFAEALAQTHYVSLDAVRNAFINASAFNVIDMQSAWKADFVIRKDRAFSREEFKRRRQVSLPGLDVWVTSPEDTILAKLEWAKESQSEQQLADALGVAIVQWNHLDMDYLRHWAEQLQIQNSLNRLLGQAKKLVQSEKEKDFGK